MVTSDRDIVKVLPDFDLRLPSPNEFKLGGGRPKRLVDSFDEEFCCLSADEISVREAAYRIRYRVYCVENRFEDPARNPDGQEMDEYDSHAPHRLLFHRPTGLAAGVVRLILPEPNLPDDGLPFNSVVDLRGPVGQTGPYQRTAEVSRFGVVRQVREAIHKHAGPTWSAAEHHTGAMMLMKNISVGLLRSVVEIAAEHGVSHLCAMMEPALLRLFAQLGVHLQPMGPAIDYHGIRQPCFADLDRLLARTWAERRDIWEILTGDGVTWPLGRHTALAGAEAY